ncbi:MAG: GerW family sporulation protein [Clostridia bacterium]|nr:GerW family sporulation protein [Clostridia bacterium]
MEQSKQSELIQTALENVKSMVDANTVTGTPITTDNGTVIIPISKVSVGIASGGVDYFGKKSVSEKKNFGGGGGTGVTVSPIAFLVINPKGKVELLNVDAPVTDPVIKVIDFVENTPELIEKIKNIFSKNEKKDENEPK